MPVFLVLAASLGAPVLIGLAADAAVVAGLYYWWSRPSHAPDQMVQRKRQQEDAARAIVKNAEAAVTTASKAGSAQATTAESLVVHQSVVLHQAAAMREAEEQRRHLEAEEQIRQLERQLEDAKKALSVAEEARQEAEKDAQNYPVPTYLSDSIKRGAINIAITGNSGVGKSSWVNAIRRLKKSDHAAAKVGVNETTMEPQLYKFPDSDGVRLFRWMKSTGSWIKNKTLAVSCMSRGSVSGSHEEEDEDDGIQVGDRLVLQNMQPEHAKYEGKVSEVLEINGKAGLKVRCIESIDNDSILDVRSDQVTGCLADCFIWDLPGAGTEKFPAATYVKEMGMRYFDMVVLMTADRFTEAEVEVAKEVKHWNVPFFCVRNKIDGSILATIEQEEIDEDDVSKLEEVEAKMIDEIREYFKTKHGLEPIYLISSLPNKRSKYDFMKLEQHMALALKSGRRVNAEQECPVCLETFAEYDGVAGNKIDICPSEHQLCTKCLPQVDKCPLCRGPKITSSSSSGGYVGSGSG
eukprot:TRINITY_DN26440_c0_g1_i1.p1 TRINITY_DN26440_c0_g1~~TRINITY_DN26440_c0_g1_i1.p1  ORF type:complete len:550 (-),score=93.60 TRINITY_DN26440_c0_g1_i1:119-1681(-)